MANTPIDPVRLYYWKASPCTATTAPRCQCKECAAWRKQLWAVQPEVRHESR